MSLKKELEKWKKYYESKKIKLDLSNLEIPEIPSDLVGELRLGVIIKGVTSNQIFDTMSFRNELHGHASFNSLNFPRIKSIRDSTKSYAFWVSNNIKAVEESIEDTNLEHEMKGVTLLEMLVSIDQYYFENKTLPYKGVVVCTGSRCLSDAPAIFPYIEIPSLKTGYPFQVSKTVGRGKKLEALFSDDVEFSIVQIVV